MKSRSGPAGATAAGILLAMTDPRQEILTFISGTTPKLARQFEELAANMSEAPAFAASALQAESVAEKLRTLGQLPGNSPRL